MSRLDKAVDVLAAAKVWKEKCLVGGESLLSSNDLWTRQNLKSLQRLLAEEKGAGDGTFHEQFKGRLQPAATTVVQLFAECLWVYYLLIDTVPEATKREHIRTVWAWSGEGLPDDQRLLGRELGKGLINPGKSYSANLHQETAYLVDLVLAWRNESQKDQIKDPWNFARWVDGQAASGRSQLRHAVLYMLFPDDFEPIMSSGQKRGKVRRYGMGEGSHSESEIWSPVRIDQELQSTRRELARLYGDQFEFDQIENVHYKTWLRKEFGDIKVWVHSTGSGGRNWDRIRQVGKIALSETALGDLRQFESKDAIRQALIKAGAGKKPNHRTLACWQFSQELSIGDVLIAFYGRPPRLLGWCRITGDYRYASERLDLRHSRSVEWHSCPKPVVMIATRNIINKPLTLTHNNWCSTVSRAFLKMDLIGLGTAPAWVEPKEDLFLTTEQFDRIVASLTLRKNVMLQGPPGVGKTFIAKRIAWHLAGIKDPDIIGMVQFHQSYAYEDFVQGWRPTEAGGFTLRDGVFLEFCKKARQRPDVPHTFIIDEINRGNLSRIFGELLMLIEADKRGDEHAIALTYGAAGERFSVPANVHILGLMNTADRSLAIVDYALRRRFAFESLKPEFNSDKFRKFLLDHQVGEKLIATIVRKLNALNDTITSDDDLGKGFRIGHSYFVPAKANELDESSYRNIIETQIAPLLREYWFDSRSRAEQAIEDLLPERDDLTPPSEEAAAEPNRP